MFKTLADSQTLSHAYLFTGPEGVGKKTFAKSFGAYLEGQDFDLPLRAPTDYLEIGPDEMGKIGIAAVRQFQENIAGRPVVSQYRLGVIDNAETLTEEAQDALLKTAEEMPARAVLILVVSDPLSLTETLRSRLQRIDFMDHLNEEEVAEWLSAQFEVNKKDALVAAKKSFARPGLAWRILFDEPLKLRLIAAENLLDSGSAAAAAIKTYLAENEDNFLLVPFLDALALVVSWRRPVNGAGWHKLMKAREIASRTGLNPRIHLLDIIQTFSK
jgi:DNA polymerase-3 subunit delta'